jgi:uncharacterized protein
MKVRVNKQTFSEGIPNHWAGGTALQTHVMNTLSLMFPDGERFFVRSVKRFAERVTDEKFRQNLKVFIGQEMQHGAAHERFNEIMKSTTTNMDWFMWLFTQPTFEVLEPWAERLGSEKVKAFALSLTSAAENMTAGFAEMLFAGDTLEKIESDEIRELLSWHAAEEIEHRDLAFDLLKEVDGTYSMRMVGMVTAYAVILAYVALGTGYFLLRDRQFSWFALPGELWDMFTRKNAIGRVFLEGMVDYMRPNFHPSDASVSLAAQSHLEKLAS